MFWIELNIFGLSSSERKSQICQHLKLTNEQNKQISFVKYLQININQICLFSQRMQHHHSSGMLDSTNSNTCTPEQKLRKISFNTTDFEQFLKDIPNLESQTVEGWGNQTWSMKNKDLNLGRTQKKPFWTNSDNKNTQSPKKSTTPRNRTFDRTKYIQKLEEKLIQLVSIKKEREHTNNNIDSPNPNYLTPKKQTQNAQQTTSTSESEGQKYQHNFTSTSLRKQYQKSPLFKIKKFSKQLNSYTPSFKSGQTSDDLKLNLRTHLNRSMLTSYEQMSERSKEISIISYPVLDQQRKPRHRRLNKLQDFKETFYMKQNPECNLQSQSKDKRQNSLFKIKISEPKKKQEKNMKLKF